MMEVLMEIKNNVVESQYVFDNDILNSSLTKEGDWLTKKRQALIDADKLLENPRLLVNNPDREVTLRKPTVLVS